MVSHSMKPEGIDRDQNENEARHRVENIDDAHHQGIDAPPRVAGDEPPGGADEKAHDRAAKTDEKRDAAASENPVKNIAPIEVRAEGMFPRRRSVLVRAWLSEGGGEKLWADHAGQDHEGQKGRRNDSGGIFFHPMEDAWIKHGI